MRKAVLHIIFLSLLLSTGISHAFVSLHYDIKAGEVHKVIKSNLIDFDSQYKNDVLVDIDDYDEYDFDDQNVSSKVKASSIIYSLAPFNLLTARFSQKSSFAGNYTFINFSRIPRYNYITLRVFRI